MPRLSTVIIPWSIAAACFAAAAVAILTTRPMFVARAAAEISETDISPEGLAAFTRVEFGATNRMMPNEIVARVRSAGTIQRALQSLHLPADDRAVADAAGRIVVRLVAGTTLIETIVRADSPEAARALAGALLSSHEALRRERRAAMTGALVAALDTAMSELRTESDSVAKKLAVLDVYKPAGAGRYNMELDTASVNVAEESARLQATLDRIESIPKDDPGALARELDDVARASIEGRAVANQEGFLVLRAKLSAKAGELANLRTQFGENSPRVHGAFAELAAIQEALRAYFAGRISQLRGQITAAETAGSAIDARVREKEERARAIQIALVSPDTESLLLRREAIRGQLRKLELRRRELLVYMEVYEPVLTLFDQPRATEAPEVAHRDARLVLAAFGALLVGISLSVALSRRGAAVL
jgi:hypothetical protein